MSYISHTMNKDTTNTTMASTKFVTMLKTNAHKIISILAHVFLEWILIILLLCNSFFAYFITKFAIYFGLKPPCPWCSRVDHSLQHAKIIDPFRSLVCDTHANVISSLTFCSIHKRLVEFESLCKECFSSQPKCDENKTNYKCSCCEQICRTIVQDPAAFAPQNHSEIKEIEGKANEGENNSGSECEHQVLSDAGSFYLREIADEDSNEDDETEKPKGNTDDIEREAEKGNDRETKIRTVQEDEVAVTESDNITDKKKIDISIKEGDTYPIERIDHLLLLDENKALLADEALHGSLVCRMECEHDVLHTIQSLKSNLETEQKAKNDLYAELEEERNAAAVAANQTMAMITRLQEEKAAMQMEALQYQRVMEEQAEYDHEALRLLNELVQKREREKEELEKELNVYRERVAEYEVKEKAIMVVQKCDAESNDVHCRYSEEEDEGNCLIECSKEWGELEDSLQELEEERLLIMKQLKCLEEKLYESEKEEEEVADTSADLCNQEVNLVPCCFSTDAESEIQPKAMASVARGLLDLVDSDEGEEEEEEEKQALIGKNEMANGSEKHAIMKEMDHVYGRLQALEADTEFLRHCIGAVSKGNAGTNLLQEILQHLKELKSAEVCF